MVVYFKAVFRAIDCVDEYFMGCRKSVDPDPLFIDRFVYNI